MNDNGADMLYLMLWLVLPISALAARRIPMRDTFKMALAWIAIFGVLFLIVETWQIGMGTGGGLRGLFGG